MGVGLSYQTALELLADAFFVFIISIADNVGVSIGTFFFFLPSKNWVFLEKTPLRIWLLAKFSIRNVIKCPLMNLPKTASA